ncbi:RNA-directed DNA polymerase [Comamonas sp.]|uniref:RNA-directed DNA polymerase n=1 Tax=Comamonas sp. TaxID=34028 RepID=UPI002648736B|nr:RNA-directed DNA polymerase [Comamonas sp.]MDN5536123.1 RNA-directed DNA polymerase [Comamonas sp.]
MHSLLDQVCDQLNLSWAWEKVKKSSVPGDIWIDEAELANFEVHLSSALESVAVDLRSGKYCISPLRPMAFPKNPDSEGNARVRQYFNFSIRDQVAWTAVVNILGPFVDLKMPNWSYGNRLFRSTWVDEGDGEKRLRKVGPYRHSSGRIYRPFQQAWPLFRRHIALSVFAATHPHNGTFNLDPDDLEELVFQRELPEGTRCPYIVGEYWSRPAGALDDAEIYWASVDLEKFYPSIHLSACVEAIVKCTPESMRGEAKQILEMLTKLPLNLNDWTDDELRHIELDSSREHFNKIPTGLLVSGFLANAALLHVDHVVEQELPRGRVAHFRYVDDHVILATSFEELISWLSRYREILESVGVGANINPQKTEPAALGELLGGGVDINSLLQAQSERWKKAKESCRLDPDFPTPLMTKTITLVSAIGRTDFTVLEDNELGILSQQLEHLLLVDLPETEMPERTRLAFAATRLARVAEARLASPEMFYGDGLDKRVSDREPIDAKPHGQGRSLDDQLSSLTGIRDTESLHRLASAANRVFGLLRRVLREKPDRVRLWTHALVIARRLGAAGLENLFNDIQAYSRDPVNKLAADYILGNSLSVLATETIRAAQTLVDCRAAGWRRAAALRFLHNVVECTSSMGATKSTPWFVERSHNQLCIGLYCANWLIENSSNSYSAYGLSFDSELIGRGLALLSSGEAAPGYRVALAWWGSKFELRSPVRRAPPLISHLGSLIQELPAADDLWSFFPEDAPLVVLARIAKNTRAKYTYSDMDGWWVDALRREPKQENIEQLIAKVSPAARIRNALADQGKENRLALPIWAERIWRRRSLGSEAEWRLGEWTCLEIVRQAAQLLVQDERFDERYIQRAKSESSWQSLQCAHPFNFTLPADLAETDVISWQEWRQQLRRGEHGVVRLVAKKNRLCDYRYAPLVMSPIGTEQNPIRGLGLCLFGLLSGSFLLPVQWNGPGHESVLRHLPQLLRNEITYSSATLGILEACLQPRASENLMAGLYQTWNGGFDDDTEHDPIRLLDTRELASAIKIIQEELERNQISTLNHRLRQVTPVNLTHLTGTDWKSYFGMGDA